MADAISGLNGFSTGGIAGVPPQLAPLDQAARGELSFQDLLLKSLEQTNQLNQEAQGSIE